jgi:predicted TIM-barrel fold metal-dependent hydrolase
MTERLISADDHIDLGYLPRDLWTSRFPTALKESAPRVVDRGGGDEHWICEGRSWGEWRGGNWFSRLKGKRVVTALDRGGVAHDGMLRPTTPELRIADMDREHVEFAVNFPPILQMKAADRRVARAVIAAYNDWAAEFARSAPDRLLSIAQMFPDSAEDSTAELLRVARNGMRQVSFLVGTVNAKMYEPEWDGFWAAAADAGVLVSYHIGGVGGFGAAAGAHSFYTYSEDDARGPRRTPEFHLGFEAAQVFYEPLVRLFTFGILRRHPGLKIVLAESGSGWIPWLIQELDFRYRRHLERKPAGGGDVVLPGELFRNQIWVTYQEDEVGLRLEGFFGEDKFMWASDYPHPDSTWPNSQEIIARETRHLTEIQRQKILYGNAKKLYFSQ